MLQKIYDFDKTHDQLIDLNKTLSDGKTYLTSFKSNIKNIREVVKKYIYFFISHVLVIINFFDGNPIIFN